MRKKQVCRVFLSAILAVTARHPGVLATKAEGYKSTSLARGRLGEIDISSILSQPLEEQGSGELVP